MKDVSFACRSIVEVDLQKLRLNLVHVRSLLGSSCKLMFVVKGNAYGHGAVPCALACDDCVDWFAVATADEALELRTAGVCSPILLFGFADNQVLPDLLEKQVTLSVFSLEYAEYLKRSAMTLNQKIPVHLKIDTGFNRLGFSFRNETWNEDIQYIRNILDDPIFDITGIYTHFSSSKTAAGNAAAYTEMQFGLFKRLCDQLEREGYSIGLRHCCASGGILFHPDKQMDMVRAGVVAYGSLPSSFPHWDLFQPIHRWLSKVINVKEVESGESVSYDRTYQVTKTSKIAVVSVGYGDGYFQGYQNKVHGYIHGIPVPQIGVICMDLCMFDVTALPQVDIGDEVLLLGNPAAGEIGACDLGNIRNCVIGEVTASISSRVARLYVNA